MTDPSRLNTTTSNARMFAVVAVAVAALFARAGEAQTPTSGQKGTGSASVGAAGSGADPTTVPTVKVPFKPEEVEALVATIALYPDSLLAQVLMASTYPLEVVQADRFAKANKSLKDKALADALNKQTWDASVKSLVDFPQVLTMMSEKLDLTIKLGDAFIADQKQVMDAVQRLRAKAQSSGNLKSSEQQNVKVETVPAQGGAAGATTQVIVVESTSPQTVYVPTYNPTVVYGGWPYPAYPPYPYYPPGYVAGAAVLSFGVGVAVGAAWGHAWGGCNWGHSEVDIDIDRNTNFNNNIDRDAARKAQQDRQTNRQGQQADRQGNRQGNQDTRQGNRTERQGSRQGSANSFQHDPSHRKGVSYRDSATTSQFRNTGTDKAAAARESYRGRAETGRQDISRGGASGDRTGAASGNRAAAGSGSSGARGDLRSGNTASNRGTSSGSSGTRSSGFSGADRGGSSARTESNRGYSSRSNSVSSSNRSSASSGSRSSASSGSRSSGGGGSRSSGGGGGSRGGGGGGRGGGGGGRR